MGSRGSMTYSAPPVTRTAPNMAAPMQRSYTQPTPSPSPGFGAPAPMMAPARHPFMAGLMGGLIGAGIGGLLFGGGSFFGHGLGFGGFLGFLLQVFLIVVVVRFLWRMFMRNRSPALAGGPGMFSRGGSPGGMMGGLMGGGGGAAAPRPANAVQQITITPADFQEFEQLLKADQAAWSARDLKALSEMATPEMVSYFSEQLSSYASRGQINTVTDVHLESGDLSQAWAEGGMEYATVAMRFSMVDVTRDSSGRVVDGSPTERVMATELWTFVRSRGGRWILSAIQQA
jgi:predicted lipid-binding transport protein (Tim44 family)